MTQAATRSVVVERDLDHPPEKVWRALTRPELISDWLMKGDFRPEVGHTFHLTGEWGGTLDCEVLVVEPLERLSYSWNFDSDDAAFALKSIVTFTLTATESGTRLRMEQEGFRHDQKQAYGGARAGWPQFFDALDQLLTRIH